MVSDSIRARPIIMVTVIFPEASGFLAIPEHAPPIPVPIPIPQPRAAKPTDRAAAIHTTATLTLPAAAEPPTISTAVRTSVDCCALSAFVADLNSLTIEPELAAPGFLLYLRRSLSAFYPSFAALFL